VQVTGSDASINQSILIVPPGTVHESVYKATQSSAVTFGADYVTGYGSPGTASPDSSVTVSGGTWIPYHVTVSPPFPTNAAPSPVPSKVNVSSRSAPRSAPVGSPGAVTGAHHTPDEGSGGAKVSLSLDQPTSSGPVGTDLDLAIRGAAAALLAFSAGATALVLWRRRDRRHVAVARSAADLLRGLDRPAP
jgi:hypothetical protein